MLDPQGEYVMAGFYLTLLKQMDEKKYDGARDGIAMMARTKIDIWRRCKKKLSAEQVKKIEETMKGIHELIENADQLCGPLLEAMDFDALRKKWNIK